jgi:hypothetical protein
MAARNTKPISPIYRSFDGRLWWVDETHPQTSQGMAVCRAVERGTLQHTCIWDRKLLTLESAIERAAGVCKCGNPCEYYGEHAGYSVACADCNAKNSKRQRDARRRVKVGI